MVREIIIFVTLLLTIGCSSRTSEIKTVNSPLNFSKKFIKGVTTKEEIIKLFGRKPDYSLDLREHAKVLQNYVEKLQKPSREYLDSIRKQIDDSKRYAEMWLYRFEDRSSISKLFEFVGGDVFLKFKESIGLRPYELSIYFDNKGIAQDYKLEK